MRSALLRISKPAAAFFPAILVASALVGTAAAQASRPLASVERRIQTMDQQSKQYEMEGRNDKKKPAVDAKRSREIKNEIAEDLNRLQTTYNNVVIALQEKAEPSPEFVQTTMASVRKMAGRLKVNLALPKPAESVETSTSMPAADSPRRRLRSLVGLVYDLITNPIFESTTGYDVKLADKASLDLDALIAFTEAK